MRGPKPEALTLNDAERNELEVLVHRHRTSVEELQAKVLAFIDYYNQSMAKPFKWTYQGKALTV